MIQVFGGITVSEPVLIAAVAAASAVAVALIQAIATRPLQRKIRETHDHVANTHDSNLRDDVDDLAKDVREALTIVRRLPLVEARLTDHLAWSEGVVADLHASDRAAEAHRQQARAAHEAAMAIAAEHGVTLPPWPTLTPDGITDDPEEHT